MRHLSDLLVPSLLPFCTTDQWKIKAQVAFLSLMLSCNFYLFFSVSLSCSLTSLCSLSYQAMHYVTHTYLGDDILYIYLHRA